MDKIVITKPRTIVPKIGIDKQIIADVLNKVDEERQVIIHCFYKPSYSGCSVRIWSSTYLRDKDSAHKSKLLTAHNITTYPTWMAITSGRTFSFTLVFEGLPKGCSSFDLFEDIPEGGGFYTGLINRNKSDVYSEEIFG